MPSVEVAQDPEAQDNEDVVLVLDNAVAVLDGATSLRPTARTGGWYARTLAEALRHRLTTDAELVDLLADAIGAVSRDYGLDPGNAPSSTASILRWNAESVEALVLADSPVVVFTDSGPDPVVDERLAELRSEGRGGYRERLRSGGGFDEEHRAALRTAVDATGRWRNVDGGFWVAEAEPRAAHRAYTRSWPRADVRAALLASDGVSCGVEDYGCYDDWTAMLAEATGNGPEAVLERVRAAERCDPDGLRWPRPKCHDDQALAVVRF